LQSLRGVTLPNEEVMQLLNERFVVGSRNIERDAHVGLSHGYRPDQSAVGTTNGAGGRNVQLLVLAHDQTVVHALPGFWHADDLIAELRLALELHRLYLDDELPGEQKRTMLATLHRAHLRRHGDVAAKRGAWQDFDVAHELARAEREPRDTVLTGPDGRPTVKPIPQLVHERLLARPFLPLADFRMEDFVDYGRPWYDNNQGVDREGKRFARAEHANEDRERAEQKEREAQQRLAEKAECAAKRKPRTEPRGNRVSDPF
jgi:hypothetical protein